MKKVRVLFLCTGNSARSIIASVLLQKVGGDVFEVHSAGTQPKGINPYTVRALEPLGVDLSGERSKSIDEYVGQRFDYVITVCDAAAEECPVFPGAERIHWSFVDPAAATGSDSEKLLAFERTVSEMQTRLTTFILVVRRDTAAPTKRS
jgi:arsenate reductase